MRPQKSPSQERCAADPIKEIKMRVLVLAKEGAQTDAAAPPTPEAMAEYQKFNEELVKAGVVLGAGRLSPSSQGKRVRFDGKKRTVIDGQIGRASGRERG